MGVLMLVVFIVGYLAIALEHTIKVDKAASALLMGGICWTILMLGKDSLIVAENGMLPAEIIHHELGHHLSEIAEILFFLLGAMTIVELIDAHKGFTIITDRIESVSKVRLLWIIGVITFFSSAILDNLTTTIVMAAILSKLMKGKDDLWMFGGIVVVAANAGGAWSPIGDVTTIMLWIGGQVTASNIVLKLFVPSAMALLVPLLILSFKLKGKVQKPKEQDLLGASEGLILEYQKRFVLTLGVGALLFVPVFKTVVHLPPYLGMLLSLGFMWMITEFMHRSRSEQEKKSLTVMGVIKKVDVPTVMFFLGILLAVGALQTVGYLSQLSLFLDNEIGNVYAINVIIGLCSSIVDNVPLVAGTMGMYPLTHFETDNIFWELLAYCAGTGGSVLIIGSAAGVAIMGIMRIDFFWYLKKISLLALVGYLSGVITFFVMN